MITNIILLVIFFASVIMAGIFAGAETGIYQLSRLRLRLGIESKIGLYLTLGKSLKDSSALLISLLLGTNLAHYLATSTITYMVFSKIQAEHSSELLAALITTPIFFIFSELIPKNIFFYRADFIMPYISPVMYFFHRLFSICGIVPLLKSLSYLSAKTVVSSDASKTSLFAAQRAPMKAILLESQEEGILSTIQIDIINRLANISALNLKHVMTALSKLDMLNIKSTKTELLRKLQTSPYTRLLVYEDQPANIIGFVNIYQCLTVKDDFINLYDYIESIKELPEYTSVTDAINIMQRENQKIILVVKSSKFGRKKTLGIATMKDLVEELFGELSQW